MSVRVRADHFRFRNLCAFMAQAHQEHARKLDLQLFGFGVDGAISILEMPLYRRHVFLNRDGDHPPDEG